MKDIAGSYAGVQGLTTILLSLASTKTPKFYDKIRFRVCSSGSERFASSILEVFPSVVHASDVPSVSRISQKVLANWNSRLSSFGSQLFEAKRFPDVSEFEKWRSEFQQEYSCPSFSIPSDTELVRLTKDLKLVAKAEIEKGTVITSVPITKSEMVANPFILVKGVTQGRIIRKVSPFCGMGSFASFVKREKSNCETTKYHEHFVSCVGPESAKFKLKQ